MDVLTFRHYNRESNEVQYAVPTTLMKRPGYNTSGKEINTQINSFPIIKYPTITIYQYDVSQPLLCVLMHEILFAVTCQLLVIALSDLEATPVHETVAEHGIS